ncbi:MULTISPECIES: thiolase family protein [Glutamicibacter]|uniref:Probable acetyl-CoA acetyltransferase n=1 Tax=Glutamicibacter soli TaxID=453836 RepID=A0A6L9G5T5_9MICC|nr:thiolase family protein [Glutamicibacter soli]NAZ16313.1 acetyl-CoA C-acyltransferase [Glutamicibacter soli]
MSTEKIAILDGARTPVGRYGGSLNSVPAHELGQVAAREALSRSGVSAEQVDEVVMGCVGQVGPDAYLARRVALGAGLPDSTPAFTVNRLCGSGLQAIWSGAQQLAWGGSQFILAGGAESMSRMPFLDYDARGNSRLGNRTVLDGTVAMLTDPFSGQHMGVTAENVADKYGISREQQDEFAAESQRRSGTSEALAAFAEEITEVTTGGRKPVTVSLDEHPRPDTTAESLSLLKPAFRKDGSVTAGNASGINDGAAAVLLAKQSTAQEHGLRSLATIEHVTTAALDPAYMGYAPTLALHKLFSETGLSPQDIDTFEVNEAFAAQALAVIRDAKLDPSRVNPYGGAIALGHPIGATGAILTLRAAKDLVRRDLTYAVVTMCIGGGQALAALIKRSGA